jgi:hypothetical protein
LDINDQELELVELGAEAGADDGVGGEAGADEEDSPEPAGLLDTFL